MLKHPRVIVLFILSLILVAAAADSTTRPALLPIVEVTKSDSTVVRGRLIDSDGLRLLVQPTAPGQQPQTIPWREIRRVNNGLTQQKAADAWKAAHKDELCTDCAGHRLLRCEPCKGTGHDLAARTGCTSCKGTGETKCAVAACKEGQVPCPAPCLKPTSGGWRKEGDSMVKSFPMAGGGTYWVSFPHCGEIIEMKNGFATGKTTTCTVCNHKATIDCPTCRGTTREACKECIKSTTAACTARCEQGMAKCAKCEGAGLRKT